MRQGTTRLSGSFGQYALLDHRRRVVLPGLASLALVCGWLGARDARAADAPSVLEAQQSRLWLEGFVAPAPGVATLRLDGQILVHRHVAIDFDLPAAFESPGYAHTPGILPAIGNIGVGAHYVGTFATGPRSGLAVMGGVSFNLPTSSTFASAPGPVQVLQSAALAESLYGLAAFVPATAFARVHFDLEFGLHDWLSFRWGVGLLLAYPVSESAAAAGVPAGVVSTGVESAAELEGKMPFGLRLGLRVVGAQSSTLSAAAVGLEPFVGFEMPKGPLFARLGVLMTEVELLEPTAYVAVVVRVGVVFR